MFIVVILNVLLLIVFYVKLIHTNISNNTLYSYIYVNPESILMPDSEDTVHGWQVHADEALIGTHSATAIFPQG